MLFCSLDFQRKTLVKKLAVSWLTCGFTLKPSVSGTGGAPRSLLKITGYLSLTVMDDFNFLVRFLYAGS